MYVLYSNKDNKRSRHIHTYDIHEKELHDKNWKLR